MVAVNLVNGGFETGDFSSWVTSGSADPVYPIVVAGGHSGSYQCRLTNSGGYPSGPAGVITQTLVTPLYADYLQAGGIEFWGDGELNVAIVTMLVTFVDGTTLSKNFTMDALAYKLYSLLKSDFSTAQLDKYIKSVRLSSSPTPLDFTYVDDVALNADIPAINADLHASVKFSKIHAHWGLGAASFAKFVSPDVWLANAANFKTSMREVVTVRDNKYSKIISKGELGEANFVTHMAEMRSFDLSSKTRKYRFGATEYYYKGLIGAVFSNNIYDEPNSPFSVSPTWDGEAIIVESTTGKSFVANAISNAFVNSSFAEVTPAESEGDYLNLYFYDIASASADRAIAMYDTNTAGIKVKFHIYVKDGSTILSAMTDFLFRAREHNTLTLIPKPKLYIYDYVLLAWEDVMDIIDSINSAEEEYGSPLSGSSDVSFAQNVVIDLSTDLDNPITNYLNASGAVNAAGYQLYELQIVYMNGRDIVLGYYLKIFMDFAQIKFTFDIDQTPEDGLGKITSTSAGTILFDNTFSEETVNLPHQAGFSTDDGFTVVKFIEDQVVTAMTDSGFLTAFGLTLNFNVTGANLNAFADDMTNMTVFQYLQQICDLLNGIWWIDWNSDTLNVYSLDQLQVTGLTITENDIVGYNEGNWAYKYDTSNMRSKVTVVGKNHIKTVTVTPDHPFSAGIEDEIYRDASIVTLQGANKLASNKALYHTHAIQEMQFEVDLYGSINSDHRYVALKVGWLVVMDLPFWSQGNDQVTPGAVNVITGIDLIRNESTGDQERLRITVQRRFL